MMLKNAGEFSCDMDKSMQSRQGPEYADTVRLVMQESPRGERWPMMVHSKAKSFPACSSTLTATCWPLYVPKKTLAKLPDPSTTPMRSSGKGVASARDMDGLESTSSSENTADQMLFSP